MSRFSGKSRRQLGAGPFNNCSNSPAPKHNLLIILDKLAVKEHLEMRYLISAIYILAFIALFVWASAASAM